MALAANLALEAHPGRNVKVFAAVGGEGGLGVFEVLAAIFIAEAEGRLIFGSAFGAVAISTGNHCGEGATVLLGWRCGNRRRCWCRSGFLLGDWAAGDRKWDVSCVGDWS